MNNRFNLEDKVRYITDYVKELNDYMAGKSEEDFRKDGVTPLEQHLMSIQLMNLTSAMIAMNDRLAILRNKAPNNSNDGVNNKTPVENPNKEPVVESGPPVLEPEVEH